MPAILLDKSAFEAITTAEHEVLGRFTHQIVPPLLVMEVLGDAAKDQGARRNPLVMSLSRKFVGSGTAVASDWEVLVGASLAGHRTSLRPQIPVPRAEFRRARDGSLGQIIRKHPLNLAIQRWAEGRVTSEDRARAELWRSGEWQFDLCGFKAWLCGSSFEIPRARTPVEAVDAARMVLGDQSLSRFWAERAAYIGGWGPDQVHQFHSRAEFDSLGLILAAPYAYSVLLGLFSTLVAWANGLIGSDGNNVKDGLYFCYTPYAVCFASDDRLHRRLAPHLLEEDQVFLTAAELRDEIALILAAAKDAGLALSFDLPARLSHLADKSKLVRALSRHLSAEIEHEVALGGDSIPINAPDIVRDRARNSVPAARVREDEEVQWVIVEQSLPRSVVEARYGRNMAGRASGNNRIREPE